MFDVLCPKNSTKMFFDKESEEIKRKIKEAIHIKRQRRPTLNRDGGNDLPPIFNHFLSRD